MTFLASSADDLSSGSSWNDVASVGDYSNTDVSGVSERLNYASAAIDQYLSDLESVKQATERLIDRVEAGEKLSTDFVWLD